MAGLFTRFVRDERGATSIEYGLVASLVAVATIAAIKGLSTKISGTFNNVGANIK